jgi:endonuclease YncB( thermonuclease family)
MSALSRARIAAQALAVLAALLACSHPDASNDRSFTATVIAVYDGDTIGVRSAAGTVRIRLVNIDCPEYRQPFSARARRFTSALVFGKQVTVEPHGRDKFDRLLARVIVAGTDLNEALVRNGLAWHYARGASDPRLAAAERQARAERAGLWADPRPVPPWQWRRTHERGSRSGVSGEP